MRNISWFLFGILSTDQVTCTIVIVRFIPNVATYLRIARFCAQAGLRSGDFLISVNGLNIDLSKHLYALTCRHLET
uniref:PDZ domain-containing protein n=1 Tax=Glossina palpalis gambiensis TaxID=67801 RepID=A0A1B0C298_9MUSC